jgi:hypothetical protein
MFPDEAVARRRRLHKKLSSMPIYWKPNVRPRVAFSEIGLNIRPRVAIDTTVPNVRPRVAISATV